MIVFNITKIIKFEIEDKDFVNPKEYTGSMVI